MSLSFLLAASSFCALLYYLCPARMRWVWLLLCSMAIYAHAGRFGVPFLVFTAGAAWFFALLIERTRERGRADLARDKASLTKEEIRSRKAGTQRKLRLLLSVPLILSFALLAVFKYSEPALRLFGRGGLGLILPLGISFYTFQAAGYLFDVYRGNLPAEKNPLRFLLFVSFFPQLIQGPIARYDRLAPQLLKTAVFENPIDASVREKNDRAILAVERGLLLIAWGFFKKKVLADRAAPFVDEVFGNASAYGGWVSVLAVLLYSLQQYCDFSGGIDMVSGIAELFGVRLAENFRRPYFSVSLADFWRRWHITLGSWMRDYVFYPFALSRPVAALSRMLKKRGQTQLSRTLPAALGNLLVFLLVGLWHGATANYLLWGLYNGLILAVSTLLEPRYKSWNEAHPALSKSRGFHIVRILRTFLVVNIGWFFDRAEHGADAFRLLLGAVNPAAWKQLRWENLTGMGLHTWDFQILILGAAILFAVSLLSERGTDVRGALFRLRLPVRWALLIPFLYFVLLTFVGASDAASGFMYAVF